MLKQLKKRLYNMKPVEKKRGPIKKKVKKERAEEDCNQNNNHDSKAKERLETSSNEVKLDSGFNNFGK